MPFGEDEDRIKIGGGGGGRREEIIFPVGGMSEFLAGRGGTPPIHPH